MEPNPTTLAIVAPVLMGLGLLYMVRRYRQRFEREKDINK
jgi:hypothetical protein